MLVVDQLRDRDGTLRVLGAIIMVGLLILVGALWYLQGMSYDRFHESEIDQSNRSVRIPAVRGKILDRHGAVLAEDRACYNLSLYFSELRDAFDHRYSELKSAALAAHGNSRKKFQLSGKEIEQIRRRSRDDVARNMVAYVGRVYGQTLPFDEERFQLGYMDSRLLPFPMVQNLTESQVARFEEQPDIPRGIDLDLRPRRMYPNGTMAAHILGQLHPDLSSATNEEAFFDYRPPDYRGLTGVEAKFDQDLRGHAGSKSVRVNRLGYPISEKIWDTAEPGRTLVTTIDLTLQRAAENALQTGLQALKNPHGGAAVVMDVNNGDVLAMASYPAYDPNIFLRRMSPQESALLNDGILTPQLNRAIMGTYAPGSIFKVITGLAAMEAGVLNPTETFTNLGGLLYKMKDLAPPGNYDFRRAFVHSSNHYFESYGVRAGIGSLQNMATRFGLGALTGIDLPHQEQKGFFPTADWIHERRKYGELWTDGNTAHICIGQELTVTPIQMAVMTAAIANGGNVLWPRIVARVEPADSLAANQEVEEIHSRVRSRVGVRPELMKVVQDAMTSDVEDAEGTGYKAFHRGDKPLLPGFHVGGKTGTAQVKADRKDGFDITWFVSFGPVENPRYAVVAMAEYGSSGGGTCAPIVEKIYQAIIQNEKSEKPKEMAVAR